MMEELNVVERPVMSEGEFKEYLENNRKVKGLETLYFLAYNNVSKVKSVRRAIRRGRMNFYGVLFPIRPFNNRPNRSERKGIHSRYNNELLKKIYAGLKNRKES